MLVYVLYVLVLSWTFSAAQPGAQDLAVSLIVGGTGVTIDKVPWQVSYDGIYGASILSKDWIITAAHAEPTKSIKEEWVNVGFNTRRGIKHVVAEHYIHPKFSIDTADYDIKLLKLKTPINLNKNAQPISLGKESDIRPGVMSLVTGWGFTKENGSESDKLMAVTIPIVEHEKCAEQYKKLDIRFNVTNRMFCAGYDEGGKDACQGDSGGGNVINNRLVGVVSFGYGCAMPGVPGVYTNVVLDEVKQWIRQVTGLKIE